MPDRPEPPPVFCARCARQVHPGRGDHYLVRIEAVADPTPPVITEDDLRMDVGAEIDRLLKRLRDVSAREALDQVVRRVVLHLCVPCYRRWIEDPAGS